MTTPAKNVSTFNTSTGTTCTQQLFPGNHAKICSSSPAFASSWTKDIRPASGNAGRVGGFRLCRPFNHLIGTIHKVPNSVDYTITYTSGGTKVSKQYYNGSAWRSGTTPPTPIMPSTNFKNRVEVEALNKLKEQEIHLGNFFAEINQTIRLFTGHTTKMAQSVSTYRNRFPAEWELVKRTEVGGLRKNQWCDIPGSWLQVQYGWRPLLSDIYGAIQHLANRGRKRLPIIEVSKTRKDTTTSITTAVGPDGYESMIQWQHEWMTKVGFVYRLNDPVAHELSSLGLINPLEIVWEVMRYSFLVDWVLPVGSWLSAWTADVGLQFLTGTQSNTSTMTFKESSISSLPSSGAVSGGISTPSYTGSHKNFVRSCYAGTPVPGLYVKNPLSWEHAANAVALLIQAFR